MWWKNGTRRARCHYLLCNRIPVWSWASQWDWLRKQFFSAAVRICLAASLTWERSSSKSPEGKNIVTKHREPQVSLYQNASSISSVLLSHCQEPTSGSRLPFTVTCTELPLGGVPEMKSERGFKEKKTHHHSTITDKNKILLLEQFPEVFVIIICLTED